MAAPRNIPLHLPVVLCVVTMAAADQSCSPTTLYTSEELDNTLPNTDAAEDSRNKRAIGHNAWTTSRRTAPSTVTIVLKPKRAKFVPKRRQQVANVRKKGACMRCRIKKLPCSGSLPCESCQRSRKQTRPTFDRWEQCVSFSMKDVNIYVMNYPCDENTYNAILCRSPIIAVKNVCPSFDDMIKWDVGSISAEFVLWMSDDHAQPGATSLVGILSSFAFESMISKFVDSSLSKHLRLLVELTSILYSCGSQASYAGCDLTDLRSLRSFVGTRVLQELELTLGNASLAAASPEKLRALFLVQFATIIAVGYLEPRIPSRDLLASISGLRDYQSPILNESCTSSPSEQVFSEARTQLLRILAHHMVYIAERAGLLDSKGSKKRIIEGSACRWNRRALFQWKEMPAPKDADIRSNVASSQDNTSRADPNMATEYPARCYHLSRSHPIQSSCRPAGGFGACVHEESLNIEPSPMDYILADYKHITSALQDVQAQTEPPASNPLVELQSIRPPHKARRCSSDHHLPSLRARDGNYAAFECLAETDRMCPPFLCTDDDDDNDNNNTINNNETSSTNGTCALKTSQPSTLQHTSIQTPSSSSSTTTTAPASPFQTSSQTPLSTTEATTNTLQNPTACRSCKLEASPFDTLDQNDLCQFCAAFLLPLHDGDDEEEREERKDEEEDGGIEALPSANNNNNNNNNNGDGDVRAEPEVRVRVLEHGSGNGNGNGRRGWMVSESGSGRFVV